MDSAAGHPDRGACLTARRRGDASLPNHEAVVDWCDVSYWHPDSLRGKVAIVTGAARGVGKGVSAALLERGASVLLVDVAADQLSSTTSEFADAGYPAAQRAADLRDPDVAQLIVTAAVETFGALHGLVNNAIATNEPKRFTDITVDDFALVSDVGPRATMLLMQAAYPALLEAGGGSIVNLGRAPAPAANPTGAPMRAPRNRFAESRRSRPWSGAASASGSTPSARSPSPTASNGGANTRPRTTRGRYAKCR